MSGFNTAIEVGLSDYAQQFKEDLARRVYNARNPNVSSVMSMMQAAADRGERFVYIEYHDDKFANIIYEKLRQAFNVTMTEFDRIKLCITW